jgi:hypothetical protein
VAEENEVAASREDDRDMWEHIAAKLKAKRAEEENAKRLNNASIGWSWLPDRCPDCRMSWNLFPPAKTQTGIGWHDGCVRCVNCKRVYTPPAAGG